MLSGGSVASPDFDRQPVYVCETVLKGPIHRHAATALFDQFLFVFTAQQGATERAAGAIFHSSAGITQSINWFACLQDQRDQFTAVGLQEAAAAYAHVYKSPS